MANFKTTTDPNNASSHSASERLSELASAGKIKDREASIRLEMLKTTIRANLSEAKRLLNRVDEAPDMESLQQLQALLSKVAFLIGKHSILYREVV